MIKVSFKKDFFVPGERIVDLKYEDENWGFYAYLNCVIFSEKFIEYQKDLFSGFFSEILDLKEKNAVFIDFKKELEKLIKDFNIKLKVFKEKLNVEEKFQINWWLQIVWKENYIAGLIWETSLIIIRNEKLESLIVNEVEEEDIDIFAEIIEGELENNDKIIHLWCDISLYLSDVEIKELIKQQLPDTLFEVLTTRLEPQKIWFISMLSYNLEQVNVVNKPADANLIAKLIQKYRYQIAISAGILIIFLILVSIFSYISRAPSKVVVTTIDGKKITLSADLNNLKRQIDAFSKLWNTNTEVAKQQYHAIMKQLDYLEKANIQVLEVRELRKKMQQLYFKGFNINIITDIDWILEEVYSFTEKEYAALSWFKQIIYTNGFINVVWDKGVLLSIISNKTRWLLQELALPTGIRICSKNLAQNGLYCVLENDDISNFSKYWLQSLTNLEKTWPRNILTLGIYWVNRLYLLTQDKELNSKGIYFLRYVLQWGNNFGKSTKYILDEKDENIKGQLFSGSTLAIDGTFLLWTKKWLVQAYRKDDLDTTIYTRIIPWWEEWVISDKDFKWKVKVIAFMNDKYVYLYDYNTQSLVVYLTSPYKTNDAYTHTYKLKYLFKLKFDISEFVKDVEIVYKPTQNKRIVYVLTDKWVSKLLLDDFFEK